MCRNSRVKDLVDLALLIRSDKLRILNALQVTFERRRTYDLPADLAPPPAAWRLPFEAFAKECGLQHDFETVFAGVRAFLAEVLIRRT